MTEYRDLETRISKKRPVAAKFMAKPPAQVVEFEGAEPSSCSYWRLAAGGKTFYTVASDHYHGAVGGYTHNTPLPPERAMELEQTLSFMTGLGYIRMEEVSGIPRLAEMSGALVFSTRRRAPRSGRRHLRGARGANHVDAGSRSERRARVAISDAREAQVHGASRVACQWSCDEFRLHQQSRLCGFGRG